MLQRLNLLLVLLLAAEVGASQQPYKPNYLQLCEYEGLYEYVNGTTLQLAASPKDTVLYVILNDGRYPLSPSGKDFFLDATKAEVRFFRQKNLVAGYTVGKDTFHILKKMTFPKSMWFPRPDVHYSYQRPKESKDGLPTGSLEGSGLNKELLQKMVLQIINGAHPNVHSVLIIKNGKLVFEEYFYEYDQYKLHQLRSATKSFTSALTGIAIDKGFIKSEQGAVIPYFPEYSLKNDSPLKKQITIQNLLANASGLDCDISNEKSAGNEVVMGNSSDWAKFTLDLPMIDTPGKKGAYCSGNVIVAGRIIEKATKQALPQFAKTTLFAPLGITNFKWDFKPDQSSAETFCQLYLRPRDMAKFGFLYLNKGRWNNKQIISADWVKQSFTKQSTVQNVDYGYLWWLKYLDADGVRYYGKAAQGNGGQRIFVWEELDMVTVITGGSYNTQSPSDEIIRKYILPAFNKK